MRAIWNPFNMLSLLFMISSCRHSRGSNVGAASDKFTPAFLLSTNTAHCRRRVRTARPSGGHGYPTHPSNRFDAITPMVDYRHNLAMAMVSRNEQKTWDVYVCQSPKGIERGAVTTLEAFVGLAPSDSVTVHRAVLNKAKGKGPHVRCIEKSGDSSIVSSFEVANVDSVDKVYRILTKHMKLEGVNPSACECLKYLFKGNDRLKEAKPSQAISMYNKALATDYKKEEGAILMKRARAYLQRAANHRETLRTLVKDLTTSVPTAPTMNLLYQTAMENPSISPSIFQRISLDSRVQQSKFRQTRYRHDMFEFSLLHAAQDSLRATQLLPQKADAWLLAGDCLTELRKLKESVQYYEKAMELDPGMAETLREVIGRNRASQQFIDMARAGGFSGDTLRLALDVAA